MNNHLICKHKKIDGSNETSIDIKHYLNSLEKKPGALNNSLALKNIPSLKSIYDIYFKTKPREFIDLLKKYQNEDLEDMILSIKNQGKNETHKEKTTNPSKVALMTENQLMLYNHLTIKEVH